MLLFDNRHDGPHQDRDRKGFSELKGRSSDEAELELMQQGFLAQPGCVWSTHSSGIQAAEPLKQHSFRESVCG